MLFFRGGWIRLWLRPRGAWFSAWTRNIILAAVRDTFLTKWWFTFASSLLPSLSLLLSHYIHKLPINRPCRPILVYTNTSVIFYSPHRISWSGQICCWVISDLCITCKWSYENVWHHFMQTAAVTYGNVWAKITFLWVSRMRTYEGSFKGKCNKK